MACKDVRKYCQISEKNSLKNANIKHLIAGNSGLALPIGIKSVWRLVWKCQGNVLVLVENICKDYCIRYEVEVLRHMDWHKSGILYGNKAVRVSFQMPPPLRVVA